MALHIIGDLHLALGGDKPMDIFPGWENHMRRLEAGWTAQVAPEDTVILAGDTSWAMQLDHCGEDFSYIHRLPGQKIILKGNHDYWWNTLSKMEAYVAEQGFDSLHFLHNNSYLAEGMAVCGTRGWMMEAQNAHDEKIIAREAGRLRLSLQSAARQWPGAPRLAVLHYPPLNASAIAEDFASVLREFSVEHCYYGHLHGYAIARAVQARVDGVAYQLVSADALGFRPLKIGEGGERT